MEIPAELQSFYVERDGAWHLDVDGAVDKAKLEEFRTTNVALMKERDELKRRFEGIDPDEVRKLAYEQLCAVLTLLAGPGVVWEVAFGSWLLLQSEIISG